MKVLVDSCVWSLALRRKNGTTSMNPHESRLVATLAEGIRDGRVVIVGPVRQEVLSGIRHSEQFEKLSQRLSAFPDAAIESADYVQAARLDNLCRAAGLQCGEVDMLLCAVAVRNQWTILTNDIGLIRCIQKIEQDAIAANPKQQMRRLLETA